jgi:hypothetical protein
MRAPGFTFLANKGFEKKFSHEREPKGLVIPILDILFRVKKHKKWSQVTGKIKYARKGGF